MREELSVVLLDHRKGRLVDAQAYLSVRLALCGNPCTRRTAAFDSVRRGELRQELLQTVHAGIAFPWPQGQFCGSA